jgi:hypothetical protein
MVVLALAPSSNPHLVDELYRPIRVLWAQVLKRAVFDYVMLRNSKKLTDRRDYISARRWLFSQDMGLIDACHVFGWPLERLRARARTMTRDEVKKMEFRDRNLMDYEEERKELVGQVTGYGDR